ncbi:signal transduction histidine kinase [Saccharothrix saharensis]|uniref:histidine kinase n=1 Tax=Saccharothrix saharensis TaxID=571190 RepID=A0A543J7C5_9PSEU|nr:histidine kinase [Saccharothrix saharensis]TQM78729.1 signal transduction histidine kinase [Saccharothrix saharensis]
MHAGISRVVSGLRKLPEWQHDALIVISSLLVGSVLFATGLYPLFNLDDPIPLWVRVLLFGGVCAVEAFRRIAPGTALAVGTAFLLVDCVIGVSTPTLVVYADLLYAATLYGPRRLSRDMVPIAVLTSISTITATVLLVPGWRATVLAAFAVLPFLLIPVWWATNVRQHQRMAEVERANARQLAKIAELDRTAAVAAERAHMARDLHDVIAGHLSAIAIQAEAALSLKDEDPMTRVVLKSVRENSVSALEEMRAMINLLRADVTAPDEPTAPARLAQLGRLIESAQAGGMRLDVRVDYDDTEPLPAAVDLTAYRIAQEALTNAMKHAPRTNVVLELRRTDTGMVLEVVNDLREGGDGGGLGTGLLNMRERTAAVGGSLTAGPTDGTWKVRAVLPLPEVER